MATAAAGAAAPVTPQAAATATPAPAATGGTVTPPAGAAAAGAAAPTGAAATTPAAGDPAGALGTAPAAATVPERYELAVAPADQAWADAQDVNRIAATAKANGWTQEIAAAFLADSIAERRGTHEHLFAEANAHAEIGGDKLAPAAASAKQFMDKILPASEPDGARLRRDLSRLGLSNYSPLIVLLSRAGKLTAEDAPNAGAGAGAGGIVEKSTEDALWPEPAK